METLINNNEINLSEKCDSSTEKEELDEDQTNLNENFDHIDLKKEKSIDQLPEAIDKPPICEPPKLISSNQQLPKLISSSSINQQLPKLISSANQQLPKLSNDLADKTLKSSETLNGLNKNTFYDSIVVINDSLFNGDCLLGENNLPAKVIQSKDKLTTSTEAATATDNNQAAAIRMQASEMISLNNFGNLNQQQSDQALSTNDCLIKIEEKNMMNHQWSSLNSSTNLNNSDSLFYFDKYFLRADDNSESLLQDMPADCVQSTFDNCDNLISSNVESLFKFEDEDQKPTAMELNYYSTQYQNNLGSSTPFAHHFTQQQTNFNSHFLNSTANLFDYNSHHYAILNHNNGGHNHSNHNGNSTTVTYSNGTSNLLPTHHHLTTFKSERNHQQQQQQYYTPQQQSSLHSSIFSTSTSSLNDPSSCNNSNFNFSIASSAQQQQCQSNNNSNLITHSMSALFDTDNAFNEKIEKQRQASNEQQFTEEKSLLKQKLIKEENLTDFSIRNSLDLVNSNDFMDFNGDANEMQTNNQQHLIVDHASNKIVNAIDYDFKRILPTAIAAATKNALAMKLNGSLLNGNASKKLITLKEAANVKLEKVKIERANGMKIYYFKCSLCTYQTNTSQSMKDHLYCIHCKAKNNYKCNICHQTFGWKNNAQRHMRRKHKIEDQTTKREAIITLI